jgi:hypothetical protein
LTIDQFIIKRIATENIESPEVSLGRFQVEGLGEMWILRAKPE